MPRILVQEPASYRLDEIYRYPRDRWGAEQAGRYITGLFDAVEGIETRRTLSKPLPAAFGIEGYFFRFQRHFVYWRRLSSGEIGIVTILRERMHQMNRFRDDFGPDASSQEPMPSA